MLEAQSFTATEFKAKCLEILDRLAARKLTRVTITKRGKVVAVLTPPETPEAAILGLHGLLRHRASRL
jgi:prevent-host-death family protein